jgi:glycosyltransferase involved in cell wall biosynthesis
MRGVWISASLPHPAGPGGDAHEFELIAGLVARGHQLHVVSTYTASHLDEQPLHDLGVAFTKVPWRNRRWPQRRVALAVQVLRARPSLPLWLIRDRLPQLARAVRTIEAEEQVDVVQITQGELAPLLGRFTAPSGLLLFDAMTRSLETRRALERGIQRRARLSVEIARVRRFERRWYRRGDGLAAVSEVDADWCEALTGRPVEVLENPIAPPFFETPAVAREPGLVSFVGSLAHHPNIDAIEWLVADIWPLVLAARPDARLLVAGRSDHDGTKAARLRALVEGAGGELEADVEDIRTCYWRSAVVAAPLRQGSGLRNKVLHAMACGAPVVASPSAMEGIPAAATEASAVATDAPGLASAIVRALDGGPAVAAEAAAARAAVEELRTERIAARHEAWWRSFRG